jgi:uncharacterized protein YceH (UPF0502 family)
MERPEPLVRTVPPAHGQKEKRFRELLSVQTEEQPEAKPERKATILVDEARLNGVELEVQNLRQELSALKEQFNTFKRQFESWWPISHEGVTPHSRSSQNMNRTPKRPASGV